MATTHAKDLSEHELQAAMAPHIGAFDWIKAKAAGFDVKTLLALLAQYGPKIFAIIMALINGQPVPPPAPLAAAAHATDHDAATAACKAAMTKP